VDARVRFPPGARLVDRPAPAKPCATCGELTGRGYPSCLGCAEVVDEPWLADWLDLLTTERVSAGTEGERELADRVLSEPPGTFPWTCTDWALRLLRCTECGGELGAGDPVCLECAAADASRWEWDWDESAADPDQLTHQEHALRQAVTTLRAPHRHRAAVVSTWRLALPFLLAGDDLPAADVRRVRHAVLAGRYPALAEQDTAVDLVNLPLLPWPTRAS
jgi:hypothetical protein